MHLDPATKLIESSQPWHIYDLLRLQAVRYSDMPAIEAPGRRHLTYRHLGIQIEQIAQQLNAIGVGRYDCIALVLPHGPEMAVAFLAISASAICAPLNPAYSFDEFDFYLSDLHAKALIVEEGVESLARDVAKGKGIEVIELSPMIEAEAGLFKLVGKRPLRTLDHDFSWSGDVALMLHTSGTTSQPKIVPLTHANICAGAYNTSAALELNFKDRCLNVVPLFHTYGLVATTLASLAVGASVIVPPAFEMPSFFEWLVQRRSE